MSVCVCVCLCVTNADMRGKVYLAGVFTACMVMVDSMCVHTYVYTCIRVYTCVCACTCIHLYLREWVDQREELDDSRQGGDDTGEGAGGE